MDFFRIKRNLRLLYKMDLIWAGENWIRLRKLNVQSCEIVLIFL